MQWITLYQAHDRFVQFIHYMGRFMQKQAKLGKDIHIESGAVGVAREGIEGWEQFVDQEPPQGALGTVRIAAMLRIVAAHNANGMTLSEIGALAGLQQSTAHRIVSALNSVGFLYRDPLTRKYYLGTLLFELFTTGFPYFDVREVCLPALIRLAELTSDTVYVTVRSGLDGVCIDRREGSYPIRTTTVEVGARRPLGIGAGSLAMLAALKPEEAESVITHNAHRYADFGTSAHQVTQSVERARDQGYVYQEVLGAPGVNVIALPLRGRIGRPFAGLSMTAIASRMTPDRATDLLTNLRQELGEIERHIKEQNYF